MANETNFSFQKLVVYKEATENTIPATPAGLEIAGLINYTVKDTQKTEVNPTLNTGGQASKKDRGSSDFAGNIENKMIGDLMPFIATHVLGAATTKANASSEAWVTITAYAAFDPFTLAGDILLHSNGTNMLVCKTAGTSGATEPDLTGYGTTVVNGDVLVDGDVEWVVRGLIKKYEGESQPCLPTFGAEYSALSGCDGGASEFMKRFGGNFLNSYEIAKANGTIIHKYSLPVVAMSGTDNVEDPTFASIEDEVGYTTQVMRDLPFGYDDLMVQFDSLEPVDTRNFRMMINRNTTLEDAAKRNTKVSNTPQMTVEGEIALKFTKEQYAASYDNDASEVKALFGKANGDAAHFTFPTVERDRVDPDFSTNEPAYLTIPLTASGTNTVATVSYVIYSEVDY